MLILTGKNLGERQRELNTKVNEAASKNVDFKQVKDETESSDIDKLFKIDLASKYMNIEYIIEVLKSGDSLYISRALKCIWMYDDKYSNIINVDYLNTNVIPFMSLKMKKKLLYAISIHIRNEDRAASFYKYCITDTKLYNIATKFLIFTSDDFKLQVLKDSTFYNRLTTQSDSVYLMNFIGVSFTLARAYIGLFHEYKRIKVLRELSYLYSVSEEKYLDMLETYAGFILYNNVLLGLRISRCIMKKHLRRVLNNPSLYVRILSQSAVVKYTNVENAKVYLKAVLPETAESFWNISYCNTYKFIIDILTDGKYKFIKEIFTTKYPDQKFEMCINFYNMQCYTLMTDKERETWALEQIATEDEILGIGKDYIWYKFVNFDEAFEKIKKFIMITQDSSKRADMVNILIESAKNQRDVETLLKYYYERHVNEQKYTKENFLDRLLQFFNVYELDNECWTALNKLFHSLEVYNMVDCYNGKSEYKIIALIYTIINKIEVHEAIKLYIRTSMHFYTLKLNTDMLTKEQVNMVFDYMFEFYMDEIRKYENVPYDDEVKQDLRKYIYFILDLLDQYGKTKLDCPELMNKFMKLDWDEFEFHRLLHVPDKPTKPVKLMRYLKEDSKLLVDNLPMIKTYINGTYNNISHLLKKIRLYFANDIAKDFLNFYNTLLIEEELYHRTAYAAAHGIFQLADEGFKADFMKKYAPTEAKINHSDIDKKSLKIQQAICAHAYYSRPPVALEHMLMYIKGDYVHFCLPMFNSYLANLPLPLCIEFVEALLKTPVSVQKHSIRLAFECFNAENLNRLVLHIWNKTMNVSLRLIIFKAVYLKISDDKDMQDKLFDTLKTITSTVHQDDDDELFSMFVSNGLPNNLISDYIEVVWKVVSQLPLKSANLIRMQNVLKYIENNFNLVHQDTVRVIIDEFIASVFNKEGDTTTSNSEPKVRSQCAKSRGEYIADGLIQTKWDLAVKYITYVRNRDDLDTKMELMGIIFKKGLVVLDTSIYGNKYVGGQRFFNFINSLEEQSFKIHYEYFENVNILMEFVKKQLEDTLSMEENYNLIWDLKLGIITRKLIAEYKVHLKESYKTTRCIKNVVLHFAKELGNIIKDYVEKGIYFNCLSNYVYNTITSKIQKLKDQFTILMEPEDNMWVDVCLGLMEFDTTEIYIQVINLMPTHYDSINNRQNFNTIIDKLGKLDNKEVRCYFYKKIGYKNTTNSHTLQAKTIGPPQWS